MALNLMHQSTPNNNLEVESGVSPLVKVCTWYLVSMLHKHDHTVRKNLCTPNIVDQCNQMIRLWSLQTLYKTVGNSIKAIILFLNSS
jgi:hypothetical protein